MNSYFKPDLFSKKNTKIKNIKINKDIDEILEILNVFFNDQSVYKISDIKKIDALGINSNNYLFKFKKKSYVLKRYNTRDTKSLETVAQLMFWLKSRNIPVQRPVNTIKKKFTLHKNDNKWRLVEYVEGKTFSGTLKEFKNTTKTIAKLSNILSKYPKKKLIEHKYFAKEDFKIIEFIDKNQNDLVKYFGKTNSFLLRKHWNVFLSNWNYVKDFKINPGPTQLIHNDLHPHNLILKDNKVQAILDWESCLLMPVGISLAYAGLKICKQTLIMCPELNPSTIGSEYKKIIQNFSSLNEKVTDNFYELSLTEVVRRLCMIFKSSILKKDKRWNKIIPIQLGHIFETKELFMKTQKRHAVCVIPARGGSKRIKNKNIKNFNDKPLISYSIKTAIRSKLFDEVVVSTDSKKIAKIAKKYGAKIPFLRPGNLANDFANDLQVINHYLDFNEKNKIQSKYMCYLYATAPLLKVSTLKKCYEKIKKSNHTRVMTVSKFDVPIQRALTKNKKDETHFKDKKFIKFRSQDLEEYFHDAGQCYWFNIDEFKKESSSPWQKTLGVELNRDEAVDIDTLEDFKLAEKLYKLKKY